MNQTISVTLHVLYQWR